MIHDKLLTKNGQYVRALDAAAGGAEVEHCCLSKEIASVTF